MKAAESESGETDRQTALGKERSNGSVWGVRVGVWMTEWSIVKIKTGKRSEYIGHAFTKSVWRRDRG